MENCAGGVQLLVLVLCVIANSHHVADAQLSRVGSDFLHQQLHHGGFALSIPADEGHFFPVFNHKIDFVQHRFARFVGLTQVHSLEHHPVAFWRGRKKEMDVGGVQLVHLHTVHLFQHFDSALHLLGFGRLVTEPLDERFNVVNFLLLVFEHFLLVGNPFQPPFHVGVVVAFVVSMCPKVISMVRWQMLFRNCRSWETMMRLP